MLVLSNTRQTCTASEGRNVYDVLLVLQLLTMKMKGLYIRIGICLSCNCSTAYFLRKFTWQ